MQITRVRIKGFRCFGPEPTTIALDPLTYLLGPNGSGKTAVIVALARMFSPSRALRDVRPEDFHVPFAPTEKAGTELWIEVDINFEEARDTSRHASVPPFFSHMALDDPDGPPLVRIRLTAVLEPDGFVEQRIECITSVGNDGEPVARSDMPHHERSAIEVHYLPARRDPADHISYSVASLLGRILRAADWTEQRQKIENLASDMTSSMENNDAVDAIDKALKQSWAELHHGDFLQNPQVAFGHGDLGSILKQLTLQFTPSITNQPFDYDRLSDGQKSLLYMSMVVAWQSVVHRSLAGEETSLDPDKLRAPVHMMLAIEEPENSLSPQYLGRINKLICDASKKGDLQGVVATHSPAMLRRVAPEAIRFLRLNDNRVATVHTIVLPEAEDDAAKYVREAVRAFPELYFARLVILGEGASEQVVLPRVLAAAGLTEDDAGISVVPLGGRHVHHFWRLLDNLKIPYFTLLDLDYGRFGGGWGRIQYACNQLIKRRRTFKPEDIASLPKWDDEGHFPAYSEKPGPLECLERHGVFFSYPIDIDIMMMEAFPAAYDVHPDAPSDSDISAVLGKNHANISHLDVGVVKLFGDYRRLFLSGSKPASHIGALAMLEDGELREATPEPLNRLISHVQDELKSLPE
ncbi:MAG: AAA family ATPase [Propionibacteriaceae bacterium]|nr:AAA family ATPase [Propionibacteriaceae bacterium]